VDALLQVARQEKVAVIEDSAQAIGAEYKGKRAGSLGDVGCFSFFPSKNLGGFGDGGICTTNNEKITEHLKALRVHGSRTKYHHDTVGLNSRLDALQAAVLSVKLRYLDGWTAARQANAGKYRELLENAGIPITLPKPASFQTRHVYNQFVIRAERRDELRAYLTAKGVGTEVYYPVPLHLQRCFGYLGYKGGDFPVSEQLSREALALPIYPQLTSDDVDYVASSIRAFYNS
jgi:dTDP-4-amino-4,6-dideoxygalactose transaminase